MSPRRRLSSLFSGRVPYARRTLTHDWLRLIISVGGIGFAILLVLLLRGVMDGTVAKSTTYIDHAGADVIVAREGVHNMTLSASVLPTSTIDAVRSVEGAGETGGIIRLPVIVQNGVDTKPATLLGYDTVNTLGGPWLLASGRVMRSDGEAVIDSVLAREIGARIGDTVRVSNQEYVLVGMSAQTAAIAGKILFVTRAAAAKLVAAPDIVNFVLVRVQAGVDPQTFARDVERQVPGTSAMTRDELSRSDRSLMSDLFIAPINVMSTIGFLVGLAIIGLTMYTTTNERLHDFGVLKAIGAPISFQFRTVLTQAAVLGIAGFIAGLIAAELAAPVVVHLVPDIGITIKWIPALETLGFVLAMSLIGAVIPVARIVRVDPLMVFRR